MIFVTVGTQFGFDRLIEFIDNAALELDEEVFFQIANGKYKPVNGEYVDFFESQEKFYKVFCGSQIIVSHAGMGNILSAKKFDKDIVVMPRRLSFGEHRNDHQLSTVRKLREYKVCKVVENERELGRFLTNYFSQERDVVLNERAGSDSPQLDGLVEYVYSFIK